MEFLVIIPIVYCLFVFLAYLFKAQPKSVDRKKLVMGLNVLLLKAVVIRNIAAALMMSSGSPILWLQGLVVLLGGIPFYFCIPACWYTSFKNWWRVLNNEEVLALKGPQGMGDGRRGNNTVNAL
jgi:hypothetical protein